MSQLKVSKFVASLPSTLEADTIYLIKIGAGFDMYVTNTTGTIVAYGLNKEVPGDPVDRNSDLVKAAAYQGMDTGAPNLGGLQSAWVMNYAQHSRIQQAGAIQSIDIYLASKPAELTDLIFTIWRYNGTTYDRIAAQSIFAQLSADPGVQSITLSTPINVEIGDLTGIDWVGSATVPVFMTGTPAPAPAGAYYTASEPTATGYAWTSQAATAAYVPIQCYIRAPHAVFIGDSYFTGYPSYFPPPDVGGFGGDITISFPHKVAQELELIYQNAGIGGENTNQILARFQADCVNKKPLYAIIDGGGNDVAQGIASSTIVSNITAMFDLCNNNNIKAFYILLPPFTNATTEQAQAMDALNVQLIALCESKNVIVISLREHVGTFRTGGDLGNLWNIKPEYDLDGVHLNNAGYEVVADVIAPILSANFLRQPVDIAAAISAERSTSVTLTNKRINPRHRSIVSAAIVTPNADDDDLIAITGQAEGLTLANPIGTPVQGQIIMIRIKDNNTPQSIAYGNKYRAFGSAAATTTTAAKTAYLCIMYNSTDDKWDLMPNNQEL